MLAGAVIGVDRQHDLNRGTIVWEAGARLLVDTAVAHSLDLINNLDYFKDIFTFGNETDEAIFVQAPVDDRDDRAVYGAAGHYQLGGREILVNIFACFWSPGITHCVGPERTMARRTLPLKSRDVKQALV